MSNDHFYFGGDFQVGTGSSQTAGQRPRDPEHREIADSPQPDMFHLILHIENVLQLNLSANKKQNLGGQNTDEFVVVANGSERRAQNPVPCHRMITSNLCYTHRPVNYHRVLVHLLQGLLACIHIIHTLQPNQALSRMMERLTRGSGGSHPRAHMRTPQHQQQPHRFPLLQRQQQVAIHTLLQCPFMFQNSEPIHMSTRKQQQKQLLHFQGNQQPDLHRVIGAHQLRCWSRFSKQLTLLSKLFVASCKAAGRQQQVTPAHNAPLPLTPSPPPPPAIPISTATATQSTPLTTQLTAHTNANQQLSSAVLASSHAPQQFLPQRLGVSQQEIPPLQQTASNLGFDGQTGAPNTQFFGTGPAIRKLQMMKQVPLVDAEQVAFYEAHRDEFQCWPSKLTFLAPPQDEWRLMMNSLCQLYTQATIPNLPGFENRYAAALFCSVAKNLSDIVGRVVLKFLKHQLCGSFISVKTHRRH